MSLSQSEVRATSAELHRNRELAGIDSAHIAVALGMSAGQVDAILAVEGVSPADVWLVRDYLEREVLARGGTPVPYSSLAERMRGAADRWFGLRDVEDVIRENAG